MADTSMTKVGTSHPVGMRLRVYDWAGEGEDRALREVAAYDLAGTPDGQAAVYTDIPSDHFEKWMALNGETDTVRNGEVFTPSTAGKAA